MPIPKPEKREDQKKFMRRCVSIMIKEYDRDQALAICYKSYRDGK